MFPFAITIPKYPNSDNFNLIFHVLLWYVVYPVIFRMSWYLMLLGISYSLVFRTSWYLALSGLWDLVFPYPVLPRISYILVFRLSWYRVLLMFAVSNILRVLVSRTS